MARFDEAKHPRASDGRFRRWVASPSPERLESLRSQAALTTGEAGGDGPDDGCENYPPWRVTPVPPLERDESGDEWEGSHYVRRGNVALAIGPYHQLVIDRKRHWRGDGQEPLVIGALYRPPLTADDEDCYRSDQEGFFVADDWWIETPLTTDSSEAERRAALRLVMDRAHDVLDAAWNVRDDGPIDSETSRRANVVQHELTEEFWPAGRPSRFPL